MNAQIHSDDTDLAAECGALGVYLTGSEPDEYVRGKYCDAHRTTDLIGPVAPVGSPIASGVSMARAPVS